MAAVVRPKKRTLLLWPLFQHWCGLFFKFQFKNTTVSTCYILTRCNMYSKTAVWIYARSSSWYFVCLSLLVLSRSLSSFSLLPFSEHSLPHGTQRIYTKCACTKSNISWHPSARLFFIFYLSDVSIYVCMTLSPGVRQVYPALMEAAMAEPLNASDVAPSISSIRELVGVRPSPRL